MSRDTQKSSSEKIIAVAGPTASGKSDIAIFLAKKFNGEVISVDSRQIYTGMDIGSGKVEGEMRSLGHSRGTPRSCHCEESATKQSHCNDIQKDKSQQVFYSEGVPHWMIDVRNPNDAFTAADFIKGAKKAEKHIRSRGKLPIFCGGTGYWMQSFLSGQTFPGVPPNEILRKKLSKKTSEELFAELTKKDPRRAGTIDPHNSHYLIRALEIVEALGKVPEIIHESNPHALVIAVIREKEILKERIDLRLKQRLGEGMIEEVQGLHDSGVSWEKLESFGLEYKWISLFLQKKVSREEMEEKLYFDIVHYAKRQMTWLRRWEKQGQKIHWVSSEQEAQTITESFLI